MSEFTESQRRTLYGLIWRMVQIASGTGRAHAWWPLINDLGDLSQGRKSIEEVFGPSLTINGALGLIDMLIELEEGNYK